MPQISTSGTGFTGFIKIIWKKNPILVLLFIFIIGYSAILFHINALNVQLVQQSVTNSSRQYLEIISQFRALYTSEVINTATKLGLNITHDYQHHTNAIPLPATLSMMLGEKINTSDNDVTLNLYSPYPFPWRNQSGGLTGDYERHAWQQLNKTPTEPVIKVETIGGVLSLRYAVADIMLDQCIDCHNNHPDSPKIDWKNGDVRGVLEISQPLVQPLSAGNHIFTQMVILISALVMFVFITIAKIIHDLQNSSHQQFKLNQRLAIEVQQREAMATQANLATKQALAAKHEAESANRAKSTFLANISHEIRTPMNAILGYTQILQRDSNVTKQQQKSLKIVGKSGEHLLALIDDVLDLSKIEAGRTEIFNQAFNLLDLIDTIDEMFSLKAKDKNILWQVSHNLDRTSYVVTGDQGKLRQILINLVGNALKFTSDGTVHLSIMLNDDDDQLLFSVHDSGIGIDIVQQHDIFEAFHQGHISAHFGGTGLGLTICQKYLNLMASKLRVESVPQQGSTFYFKLLLPAVDSDKLNETLAEIQQQDLAVDSLQSEHDINILIVDDITINRDLLKWMLTDVGFTTFEAVNGQQALDLLQQQEIDLVFTDLDMPVMSGQDLLNNIKLRYATLPVIAISASQVEHNQAYYQAKGFDSYIAQPFHFRDIYHILAQLLNLKYNYKDPEPKLPAAASHIVNNVLDEQSIRELIEQCDLYLINDVEQQLLALAKQHPSQHHYFATLLKFVECYDLDGLKKFLMGNTDDSIT